MNPVSNLSALTSILNRSSGAALQTQRLMFADRSDNAAPFSLETPAAPPSNWSRFVGLLKPDPAAQLKQNLTELAYREAALQIRSSLVARFGSEITTLANGGRPLSERVITVGEARQIMDSAHRLEAQRDENLAVFDAHVLKSLLNSDSKAAAASWTSMLEPQSRRLIGQIALGQAMTNDKLRPSDLNAGLKVATEVLNHLMGSEGMSVTRALHILKTAAASQDQGQAIQTVQRHTAGATSLHSAASTDASAGGAYISTFIPKGFTGAGRSSPQERASESAKPDPSGHPLQGATPLQLQGVVASQVSAIFDTGVEVTSEKWGTFTLAEQFLTDASRSRITIDGAPLEYNAETIIDDFRSKFPAGAEGNRLAHRASACMCQAVPMQLEIHSSLNGIRPMKDGNASAGTTAFDLWKASNGSWQVAASSQREFTKIIELGQTLPLDTPATALYTVQLGFSGDGGQEGLSLLDTRTDITFSSAAKAKDVLSDDAFLSSLASSRPGTPDLKSAQGDEKGASPQAS
ncbi:MAG TPA: hypothetical protein VLJ86_18460 [Ramlibacter sp.]|nr:hypothetical protein [Ramlibacter sp.]